MQLLPGPPRLLLMHHNAEDKRSMQSCHVNCQTCCLRRLDDKVKTWEIGGEMYTAIIEWLRQVASMSADGH